ncbi:hypothetical protein L6R29_05405 [Myxococcota bacterium]|nr:hypothetical protein [Myxococcota bacterium]
MRLKRYDVSRYYARLGAPLRAVVRIGLLARCLGLLCAWIADRFTTKPIAQGRCLGLLCVGLVVGSIGWGGQSAYAGIRPDPFTAKVFTEKELPKTALEQEILTLFVQGKMNRARTLIEEKLLPRRPNSYVGRFVLAYLLRHQEGELVLALRYLRESNALYKAIVGRVPSLSHHVMMLEMIYSLRQLGRDAEALKLIQEHDRLYPIYKLEDLMPWSLMKLRRYSEATNLALTYLQQKKYKTTALNALCAITFEQGKRVESLHYCREAFVEDEKIVSRDRTTHRTNLAEAYLGVFRFDEAERYALEATRYFYPSLHTNPWEFLTFVYLEQGRLNQGFNALRQAQDWKNRQLPHLKESMFAGHQLSQGNFWLSVGDVDRAHKALELVRDRPDRHGHTSADPRQQSVGAHMMLRHSRLMQVEIAREDAAAQGWWQRVKNWFWRQSVRISAWLDGSIARRQLASDMEFLQNTLSPYRSGGATAPYWLIGEVVVLIGPAVVRDQLRILRARDEKHTPEIRAFYDALEAEAAYRQASYDEALMFSQRALAALPEKSKPLRTRMWGIRADIHRVQGQEQSMREALARVLQLDGTVMRRLGLALPVHVQTAGSADVWAVSEALLRSPRFVNSLQGFRLMLQEHPRFLAMTLSTPQGTVLARTGIARKPKEKPDEFLLRANREIHQAIFSHKTNFSRKDASSLDDSLIGTPSDAIPWQQMLDRDKKQKPNKEEEE